MKKSKFYMDMSIPRASKDLSEGENIVKLGLEIDFLTKHLQLTNTPTPVILNHITGGTKYNCKFVRDETTWYLVADKDIKKERALVYSLASKPWFV
jgi:hypothetical protein